MNKIYIINAPKRSGHHAFINSLLIRNQSPFIFINNPAPRGNSPYQIKRISKAPELRFNLNNPALQLIKPDEPIEVQKGIFSTKDIISRKQFKMLFNKDNNLSLVLNFEDSFLKQKEIKEFKNKMSQFLNVSKIYDIKFMRDPLNLFASRLRRSKFYSEDKSNSSFYSTFNKKEQIQEFEEVKEVFRKYLIFSSQNDEYINIDYISWLKDESYRENLKLQLEIEIGTPIKRETAHGGGSSFSDKLKTTNDYSNRFGIFVGTSPFDELVKYFKNEILKYYQGINEDILMEANQFLKDL